MTAQIPLLFVHGAFQGGWIWERILPFLPSYYEMFTPTLSALSEKVHEATPAIGLDDHIADICNIIDEHKLSNVILVGHSYGGIVISGVIKQRPHLIKTAIYLDAVVPSNHESLLDALGEETALSLIENAKNSGNGWKIHSFPAESFGLENQEDIKWAMPKHSFQSLKSFSDRVSIAETTEVTYYYIHCKESNPFLLSQAKKARLLGWNYFEIDSAHCPMITHPELLANLLCDHIL